MHSYFLTVHNYLLFLIILMLKLSRIWLVEPLSVSFGCDPVMFLGPFFLLAEPCVPGSFCPCPGPALPFLPGLWLLFKGAGTKGQIWCQGDCSHLSLLFQTL